MNTPLLKDVLNRDRCIRCKDNDEAKQIFIDLKSLLGYIDGDTLEPGKLSNRQFYVAVEAVSKVHNRDLVGAVSKAYDFIQNFQDNDHKLSNPEYVALNMIAVSVLG